MPMQPLLDLWMSKDIGTVTDYLKFRINNNHFEINEDTDEFYNEYVEVATVQETLKSEIIFTAFLLITSMNNTAS